MKKIDSHIWMLQESLQESILGFSSNLRSCLSVSSQKRVAKVKPLTFLRDTENGRNSRNRGVENGKWQVSFSEMIRLIFVQNLSQFGRAFNKMLGKVYLLPTFPSKCCFICLLGSYFCSLNALFGSPVRGNVCRAAILFVYTWRSVSRTLQKIP